MAPFSLAQGHLLLAGRTGRYMNKYIHIYTESRRLKRGVNDNLVVLILPGVDLGTNALLLGTEMFSLYGIPGCYLEQKAHRTEFWGIHCFMCRS